MADTPDNESREETSNTTGNNANDNTRENDAIGVQNFLMIDKTSSILWLIRLYMIFSTLCYILPIFGCLAKTLLRFYDMWEQIGYEKYRPSPIIPEFSKNCYKRVLLGSAAISALRLHQRLPRVQLNMEFARTLMVEDSLHYLMYSLLFLVAGNATMVLSPILLFAVMHASSYTKKVINASGYNGTIAQKLIQYIDKLQNREMQQQVFLFIATTEIVIFIISILMIFGGQASFMVPVFYYRFLQLRYTSRRNPYSRMAFTQFNLGIQRLAYHPKCPSIGQKVLLGIISIAHRLAPAAATAQ